MRIPAWANAILLIAGLSFIGYIISASIGVYIPFWILLGFSIIYSVERWFYYPTKKHRTVGKLYRLFLNLSLLLALGVVIWTGIKLFSREFVYSPLIGSLIFIGELVFFFWLWKIVAKNSWRWPSMKLTVFSLMVIAIIFAYAGVQPVAYYKDQAINNWNTYWAEQKIVNEERQAQAKIDEEKRAADQRAREAQDQTELNQDYAQLFNEFRATNGERPLVFDSNLNGIASLRALEISQPGNFNHDGIKQYNLGENIAMLAYSTDSNASLIQLWANSPGHRSNMLNSTYTRTGFARIGRYAVQVFNY